MKYPEHWDFLGHTTPDEDLEELRRLAKEAPAVYRASVNVWERHVVEVGSFVGGTAWEIASVPHIDNVYCIDHWIGSPDGDFMGDRLGRIAREVGGPEAVLRTFCSNVRSELMWRIIPLTGTSEFWAAAWPMQVSMVFLDGDHEKLARDIDIWLPHVVSGGICSGHDYGFFPSVTRDVDAMRDYCDVRVKGTVWSFRKP